MLLTLVLLSVLLLYALPTLILLVITLAYLRVSFLAYHTHVRPHSHAPPRRTHPRR